MNKGIAIADGDIIGILNSDDFYASTNILQQVVQLFETTGCDAIYGNLDFVAPGNIAKVIRYWKSSPYISGSFQKGWHPPHPTFFVKREVYAKYGLFDTSLEISADFELMLRFIEKNKITTQYLNNTIVKMRYGGVSTTSLKGIIAGNNNVLKAFRKNQISISSFYTIQRVVMKLKQFLKR
jgi:glycosyltransferase involved in cell wall biosynthesis